MNGKRSYWMMLISKCDFRICLSKGTEFTCMARVFYGEWRRMPMAGSEALRETQEPSSNQVSNRPKHPLIMGLPQATDCSWRVCSKVQIQHLTVETKNKGSKRLK